MDRTLRRFRVVLVTGLITLSLTAFAGSVSAAPAYVGACNMLQAGGGMENAMTVNNPNGNAGMYRAVDVSGC